MTEVLQELNKNHYRNLVEYIRKANDKLVELPVRDNLKEANEILEQKFKLPYGFQLRPIKEGYNGALRYLDYLSYDGHTYTIELGNFENGWRVTPSGNQIDGHMFHQDWLHLQLETDLEGIRQKQWFEVFSLQPLETLVSTILGIPVKLEKQIFEKKGEWKMTFSSPDNLVQHAGICKAIMKDLRIDSFGACSFYYDKVTGEQKLSIPAVHFSYEHTQGGSNGYEIVTVYYDMYSGDWSYRKVTDYKVEYVRFYNSNMNEYENMPATV